MTLRVTVWNEFRHEKQNEQIGAIYPDGMHTAIANRLGKESDIEVRTATLDEPKVIDLIQRAVKRQKPTFPAKGKGYTVVKSISAKQRPRRTK